MHADVHESAERGHIGDGALEDHADLQIVQRFHAFHEFSGLEGGTRIAARFFQFAQNVGDRGHAEFLVHELCGG